MKNELKKLGYSQEEEYFFKLNQELIENRRHALDEERRKKAAVEQQKAHWLKCPKCGFDMQEIELYKIKVERCGNCLGIYLDQGELETLFQTQKSHSFMKGLQELLKHETHPSN